MTPQTTGHWEFVVEDDLVETPAVAVDHCPRCEAVGEGCTTAACHGLDAD